MACLVAGAFVAPASAHKDRGGEQVEDQNRAEAPACRVLPGLYFVDAHSQMDQAVDEERVLSLMDHGGVYRTLLSNHLERPPESLRAFAKREPGRIVPMLRAKGDLGGPRMFAKWQAKREAELASGAYRGIAEMLIWHQGVPQHGIKEIRFAIGDDYVRSALDIAKKHGWPFIAHIEFDSLSGAARKRYMRDLEAMVSDNPATPVVMIHMGQLPPAEVERLITAHPNIYFLASHSNPIIIKMDHIKHWQNLFQGRRIAAKWLPVIEAHPDRFIFALDNVFAPMWTTPVYLAQMALWWCALSPLPPRVAQAIAHGNAERLWKLAPKPDAFVALDPWKASVKLGPVTGKSRPVKINGLKAMGGGRGVH